MTQKTANSKKVHPNLIDTQDELQSFCRRCAEQSAIAVDTEFIMEKRYWAQLCLVQVGFKGGAAVIDTMKPGLNLQPLWDLMTNRKIEKVFHASYEDIVILRHYSGELPAPTFDAQIAAMFCWDEDNPGYGALVKKFFGKGIDKSQQRSDWAARPLQHKQVEYALHDVTYLIRAHSILKDRLVRSNRLSWFQEEYRHLNDEKHYIQDPHEVWKRLRLRHPSGRALAVLREVAAWREQHARQRNLPARWVLSDKALEDLAEAVPQSEQDIKLIRSLPQAFKENGSKRAGIWRAVEKGLQVAPDKLPVVEKERKHPADPRLVELLRLLLNMVCKQQNIAPSIVANANDLRIMASNGNRVRESRLLKGWRYELFGAHALALKAGELTFGYRNGKVVLAQGGGKVAELDDSFKSNIGLPARLKRILEFTKI